jgi:hypothetical protein
MHAVSNAVDLRKGGDEEALTCASCAGWGIGQALVQRVQQVLTLAVLEGSPSSEVEETVSFLGLLFQANQAGRQLPISDFYNDAGASWGGTHSSSRENIH